ncbi:MAG: aminopeptidase P family protein [Chloroflexota bacterium]
MTDTLIQEKLDQAVAILQEKGVDAWLTFVRETSQVHDPCLDLILGLELTWQSALLIGRGGERIAIVGFYDTDNVRNTGGWSEVIGYHQSLREPLWNALERLNPTQIAVNFSESDPAADGLTHGMYLVLTGLLAGTPYADRLISAEAIIGALRGRKTPGEVARIRRAIATTEEIFAALTPRLRPGQSELEIAAMVKAEVAARGLAPAWSPEYCPIVNAGPDSSPGHAAPAHHRTQRGHLLHLDFGVKQDGFVSDLQRMWYFLDEGESGPPDDVRRAWEACWAAMEAGRAALKPGAQGWEVDAAARAALVAAGYPEYQHALGHHMGRTAHDGATVLGPRWERYGRTPYGVVEPGYVMTLELGTAVPNRGYIGLEEDVLVTESGAEYLSTPQKELWCI